MSVNSRLFHAAPKFNLPARYDFFSELNSRGLLPLLENFSNETTTEFCRHLRKQCHVIRCKKQVQLMDVSFLDFLDRCGYISRSVKKCCYHCSRWDYVASINASLLILINFINHFIIDFIYQIP